MLTYALMTPQQRPACVRMAAQAFENYDYFTAFFPRRWRRKRCLRHMLDASFAAAQGSAVFLTASQDGQLAAVAELLPPGVSLPPLEQSLRSGAWKALLWGGLKPLSDWAAMDAKAEAPCQALSDESWFLSVLTVAPSLEGRGIGSRMLQEGILPYIRQQGGTSLCLFTNAEINCRFYEKNGFQRFHTQSFEHNGQTIGSWSYRMEL